MIYRLAALRGTLLIASFLVLFYGPAFAQLSIGGAPQDALPPGKHLALAVVGDGSPSFAVHRGSSPVNDNCQDAEIVSLEANSSVTRIGDNTGATNQFGFGNSVWEAFTTTECLDVTVAYCGTAPAFSAAFTYLFVGCPLNNLVYIPDQNVNPFTCGDGNFTLTFPQVPPGTYYYGVLQGTGSTGPYQLTFSGVPCSAVPPANDVCEGATELVPGVVCNATTGDVSGALVSGASLPPVSCTFVNGDASDDVWFSFVATDPEHTIEVVPSQRFDAVIDLRAGPCGESVPIACADAVGRGGAESVTFDGLVVGTTYFIRVYDWYAGLPETSTFQICVLAPTPVCDASAGTLVAASTPCLQDGSASLSATLNGDAIIPAGYELVHVLTQGEGLVILATGTEPLFTVDATGLYTIHTLVFDPSTLDLGLIEPGVTTGFDVNALLVQGGGSVCGSLDVTGAAFNVDLCCTAAAGNIAPDAGVYCLGQDGTVVVSATPDGNAVVPDGYLLAYALTEGSDLVIVALGGDPVFTVPQAGDYTIHTLVIDPNSIDPGQVELGVTTGNDIHAQLIQGGGAFCGAIDLLGAAISVQICCEADAGSLTPGAQVCLLNGSATLNAVVNGDQVVPDGYQVAYALTQGGDLVIIDAGAAPEFTVDATGTYTIHTLVYDPNTLDLSLVEFGVTTGFDVAALLIQGGGAICGSLDVAGAAFTVQICCDAQAGTLLGGTTNCFTGAPVQIAALPNGDAVVPSGFETLYVLTSGPELLITAVDEGPAFEVDALGDYTIHTLVYDPSTLDLSGLELGVTTGFDVNALLIQGGGDVCASLDVTGAAFLLQDCSPSNDDCGSATVLNVQLPENCPANATAGDNTYATQDGGDPTCDGTDAFYADVWYVFNSGNNTEVTINFDSGTMTDHVIVVSDACGGNEVLCALAPGATTPLEVAENTDYRVRVYSNWQYGEPGQFSICISGTVPTVICDGGDVQTSTGEVDLVVCQDEQADLVVMVSNSTSTEDYTFILTDEADVIVTPLAGDVLDFNSAGLGAYRVWGVSHNGALQGLEVGQPLGELTSSGDCISVSENFVTVLVEICTGVQQIGNAAWGVHPNPGNGDFTLRYAGGDASVVLEVIDMSGRLVHTRQFPMGAGQVQQVSLAGQLAQGFYTLRLSAEGRTATLRLAVQ